MYADKQMEKMAQASFGRSVDEMEKMAQQQTVGRFGALQSAPGNAAAPKQQLGEVVSECMALALCVQDQLSAIEGSLFGIVGAPESALEGPPSIENGIGNVRRNLGAILERLNQMLAKIGGR